MDLHKERIAQLRELRAAVSKPMYNGNSPIKTKSTASASAAAAKETAKANVHDKAMSMLQNPVQEQSRRKEASSAAKDPVHRKLQSTVQLLSESLEEQGNLRALLELSNASPEVFDTLLYHLSEPSEQFVQQTKIRSMLLEKEKLLTQMMDMRCLLDEERGLRATLQADLDVTQDMLQEAQNDLHRAEAEISRLREHQVHAPGHAARPGTPPSGRRGTQRMFPNYELHRPIVMDERLDSPDVSLGRAEDYPLPEEEEEEEEEDDLDELDFDAAVSPQRQAPVQQAAQPDEEEDRNNVCVVLDIDLGGWSDQIVINTTENPMFLAYAFMEKHSLSEGLFEPLLEYISSTQQELIATTKEAAVATSPPPAAASKMSNVPGSAGTSSTTSPLVMESIDMGSRSEPSKGQRRSSVSNRYAAPAIEVATDMDEAQADKQVDLDSLFSPRRPQVQQIPPVPAAGPVGGHAVRSRRASMPPPPPPDEDTNILDSVDQDYSPMRSAPASRTSSPYTYPLDKSLSSQEIGEIINIAADVLQRANDLKQAGQMQYALPLYENAMKLFELTECQEMSTMRDIIADNLL